MLRNITKMLHNFGSMRQIMTYLKSCAREVWGNFVKFASGSKTDN